MMSSVWSITSRLTLNTCPAVNSVKVSRTGSVSHVLNRVTSRLTPRLANHSVTYVQCVPRHVWSKTSFSGGGVYLTAFCVKSTFTAGHLVQCSLYSRGCSHMCFVHRESCHKEKEATCEKCDMDCYWVDDKPQFATGQLCCRSCGRRIKKLTRNL